ncbi:MAG: isochorismatase family protein, partial [Syntrophomonadaceae bacterium]|nr:isochorismatase family protein [Syntrophomonadaceae bacterium]
MSKYELDANQAVLLVIDLQEKLMAAMPTAEKVIRNARLLLQLAHTCAVPVIVTEQYPRGLGRTVPEIQEVLGEHTMIEKLTFSAMVPELQEKMEQWGRKQVVVVGTETHVCVFQTVRDLVEEGFEVQVVRDAVASRFKENFENGLALMAGVGAVVT